jgi:hypothetical protein
VRLFTWWQNYVHDTLYSALRKLQELCAHYYLRNMLLVGFGGVDHIYLHVNRFVRQQVRSTLYGVCGKYFGKIQSSNRLVLLLEFPVLRSYLLPGS